MIPCWCSKSNILRPIGGRHLLLMTKPIPIWSVASGATCCALYRNSHGCSITRQQTILFFVTAVWILLSEMRLWRSPAYSTSLATTRETIVANEWMIRIKNLSFVPFFAALGALTGTPYYSRSGWYFKHKGLSIIVLNLVFTVRPIYDASTVSNIMTMSLKNFRNHRKTKPRQISMGGACATGKHLSYLGRLPEGAGHKSELWICKKTCPGVRFILLIWRIRPWKERCVVTCPFFFHTYGKTGELASALHVWQGMWKYGLLYWTRV